MGINGVSTPSPDGISNPGSGLGSFLLHAPSIKTEIAIRKNAIIFENLFIIIYRLYYLESLASRAASSS